MGHLGTVTVLVASTRAELKKIREFHAASPSSSIAERQNEAWMASLSSGWVFCVVDEKRDIVASGTLFAHHGSDGRIHYEVAAARVPKLGGFEPYSLQMVLLVVRAVLAIVTDHNSGSIFGVTQSEAMRSQQHLQEIGFQRWLDPDSQLIESQKRAQLYFLDSAEKTWWVLHRKEWRKLARTLVEWSKNGIELSRTNSMTRQPETLHVELDLEAVKVFQLAIEQYAIEGSWPCEECGAEMERTGEIIAGKCKECSPR